MKKAVPKKKINTDSGLTLHATDQFIDNQYYFGGLKKIKIADVSVYAGQRPDLTLKYAFNY